MKVILDMAEYLQRRRRLPPTLRARLVAVLGAVPARWLPAATRRRLKTLLRGEGAAPTGAAGKD